jgi:hypothetical protein
MIHIVVSVNHLRDEFEVRRGIERSAPLCQALWPLFGKPLLSVDSIDDLKNTTVFELLSRFHERAIELIRQHARDLIIDHRERLAKTAKIDYHQPLFETTEEDAAASLAIHGLFPHGVIAPSREGASNPGDDRSKTQVVLPDFLIASRLYADFPCNYWGQLRRQVPPDQLFEEWKKTSAMPANPMGLPRGVIFDNLPYPENLENVYSCIDGTVINLSTNQRRLLECHLCDRLEAVYRRALDYWTNADLRGFHGLDHKVAEAIVAAHQAGDAILVIGSISSFRGYQSIRSQYPEIPPVGHHPLLTSAAIRQGLARTVASSCFSMGVWSACSAPVRHFLLQAAEIVGRSRCRPLIPQVPFEDQLNSLYAAVRGVDSHRQIGRGHYVGGPPKIQGLDIDRNESILRQLGIETAFRKMQADRNEAGDGWAWIRTIAEFHAAMFDDNIERSLHLQDALDLYPLHKRVLGLVEYVIIPRLVNRRVGGNGTSALWNNSFMGWSDAASVYHSGLASASLPPQAGLCATLETEGNWLIHAAAPSSSASPIDLAALLDGIVMRMSTAPDVAGVSVNLQPPTPQVHAQQLAALADATKHKAACMVLYLGKLALILRNAVEHGADRVTPQGLVIDTKHFWDEYRPRKSNDKVLAWLHKTAVQVTWTSKTPLPLTLPSAANAFILTPASLHRCLVLLSLVIRGGFGQLRI